MGIVLGLSLNCKGLEQQRPMHVRPTGVFRRENGRHEPKPLQQKKMAACHTRFSSDTLVQTRCHSALKAFITVATATDASICITRLSTDETIFNKAGVLRITTEWIQ